MDRYYITGRKGLEKEINSINDRLNGLESREGISAEVLRNNLQNRKTLYTILLSKFNPNGSNNNHNPTNGSNPNNKGLEYRLPTSLCYCSC